MLKTLAPQPTAEDSAMLRRFTASRNRAAAMSTPDTNNQDSACWRTSYGTLLAVGGSDRGSRLSRGPVGVDKHRDRTRYLQTMSERNFMPLGHLGENVLVDIILREALHIRVLPTIPPSTASRSLGFAPGLFSLFLAQSRKSLSDLLSTADLAPL
jgi:hypothetical protein